MLRLISAVPLLGALLFFPVVAGASENHRPKTGVVETIANCGEVEIRVSWRWRETDGIQPLEAFAVIISGRDAMDPDQRAQMLDDLNLLSAQGAFYRSARIMCGVTSAENASIVLEADQDYYSDANLDLVLIRVNAGTGRVVSQALVHRVRDERGAQVPLRENAPSGG